MKATQVSAPIEQSNAKPCSGPGCRNTTHHPYAKERGETYFCKRDCWEAWRQIQYSEQPSLQLQHL